MAITLNKIVTAKGECNDFSALRDEILAAARAAKEAGRHDKLTVELGHANYNLSEPLVLSAVENPELKDIDLTIRAKHDRSSYVQALASLVGDRFVPIEGKPYFTYQMDKDAEGNYPRFHDLHLNYRRIDMAKSPVWRNLDVLTPENRDGTDPRLGFYAPMDIAKRLAEGEIGATELIVHIEWQFCALHVTGVDLTDTKVFDGEERALIKIRPEEMVLFCQDCHGNLNVGNREVYLRNCPAFVSDEENTYAYDWFGGVLYINPKDKVHMRYHLVQYPTLENLFILEGLENLTLSGIVFTGTTSNFICDHIYYSGQANCEIRARRLRHAAVLGSNMKNLTVKDCIFRDLGGNGLLLVDQTNRARILGNVFEYVSMSALSIGNPTSSWGDPVNRNFSLVIENNRFEKIAYEYPSALCIYVGMVDTLKLRYNTVESCAYSAVSVGWSWSRAPYSLGESCNIRNAEIAFNYIHNYMDVLRDGGAIYVLGGNCNPDTCSERFNCMHDNYAELDVARDGSKYGYYCDGSSTNWDVRDSVIINCITPVFAQHTVASAFAYHDHFHNIYSTTPPRPGSHAPGRDCLIYDYHMVEEGKMALLEKYPEAVKIRDAAGCQKTF